MSLLNNRPPESHLVSSTDLVLAESRKRVPNQSLRVYKGYSEGWHVPATAKIVEAFRILKTNILDNSSCPKILVLHVLMPKGWPSYHWFTLTSLTPTSRASLEVRTSAHASNGFAVIFWKPPDAVHLVGGQSCAIDLHKNLSFSDPL